MTGQNTPRAGAPLVSVVTIFLDGEAFIEEAVESVLAQTYPNWELALVDDGSTDGSSEIAQRYARRFPERIRYLEHQGHQNRGMSASRNLGIRHTRGEYVAFLDADDVYLPEKLERQVAILEAQPRAAMVYGATPHWHSWTGDPADGDRDYLRRLGVPPDTLVEPPTLIPLFLCLAAQTPQMSGVLVRREAIEAVGGFEEHFRGMYEDQVFCYKLCLRAPVFVESGQWDRYRQHSDSHCQVKLRSGEYGEKWRLPPTYQMFLEWVQEYMAGQGVTDREVWSALRRELWPYRHPRLFRLRVAGEAALHEMRRLLHRTRYRIRARLGAVPRVDVGQGTPGADPR